MKPAMQPSRTTRGTAVSFAYASTGGRSEVTVEGQGTVYYEYDVAGNMTAVLDGKTDSATYCEYDAAGKVTVQRHPNATTTYFSYDGAGRLSEKVTRKEPDGSVLVRSAHTSHAEARDRGNALRPHCELPPRRNAAIRATVALAALSRVHLPTNTPCRLEPPGTSAYTAA